MKKYTKYIGYDKIEALYVKDPTTFQLILLETDSQLYEIVNDLSNGPLLICM